MLNLITDFLSRRRVAIVGVSHEAKEFSRMVFRAFQQRGYDVVPVHPNMPSVEGARCFPRAQDIEPRVDAALIMTPPAVSEQVARDCIAAGIQRIWLYRRCPEAETACAAAGVAVVTGECPIMYLEKPGFIHRVHRWFHDRSKSAAASAML